MIGADGKVEDDLDKLNDAKDEAAFQVFKEAGKAIRDDAKRSIKRGSERRRDKQGRFRKSSAKGRPSAPGTPPHTHKGQKLKKAIQFASDRWGAWIGTSYRKVGLGGEPHEKGAYFKGQQFKKRAFMVPATTRQAPRFAKGWLHSIGQ